MDTGGTDTEASDIAAGGGAERGPRSAGPEGPGAASAGETTTDSTAPAGVDEALSPGEAVSFEMGMSTEEGGGAASPSSPPSETSAVGTPSAGCGLGAARPADGGVEVAGEYIFNFPEKYDGVTPLPVLWAFHANANPNTQLLGAIPGTPLASEFVGVFPKSADQGWNLAVDGPRFEGWLQELSANYCIDESRMFAMGHSSGAQFIESLLCSGETRFRAVAPSASARTCEGWSSIPTLLIHGVEDTVRGTAGTADPDGQKDLVAIVESNACGAQTVPYATAACSRDGAPVDAGCVRYEGCVEPTIWCNHDDPNYAGTNHGWPCFASQAIGEFFVGLL